MMRKLLATAGIAAMLTLGGIGAASAAAAPITCYTGCEPPVSTTVPIGPSARTTEPAPAVRGASGLAFTGADIAGMTVVGLGAVAGGGVLVRHGRRRGVEPR